MKYLMSMSLLLVLAVGFSPLHAQTKTKTTKSSSTTASITNKCKRDVSLRIGSETIKLSFGYTKMDFNIPGLSEMNPFGYEGSRSGEKPNGVVSPGAKEARVQKVSESDPFAYSAPKKDGTMQAVRFNATGTNTMTITACTGTSARLVVGETRVTVKVGITTAGIAITY